MPQPSLTLRLLATLAFAPPVLYSQATAPTAPTLPSTSSTLAQLGKTSPLTGIPEWSQLGEFNGTLTFDEFIRSWETIYADVKKLPEPWTLGPESLEIATGGSIQQKQRIEFRKSGTDAAKHKRYWRHVEELPELDSRPVLSDIHIALDPGHIGGSYAEMEERYLCFNPATPEVAVREGDSTLLVAQVLKSRLEEAGARVSLVRDSAAPVTRQRPADLRSVAVGILGELGITAPTDSYAGLTGDQRAFTIQWQTEKLFYRVSEIRARADKVNLQLKPDMVVCLH